jgi:hypothetical protein
MIARITTRMIEEVVDHPSAGNGVLSMGTHRCRAQAAKIQCGG